DHAEAESSRRIHGYIPSLHTAGIHPETSIPTAVAAPMRPFSGRNFGLEKVLDPDWQLAQPPPGGMEDGIGNGGGNTRHGHLAEALRAGAVEREVRLIDELHLNGANIGIHRQHIFGEICIEETAETRIDLARLTQRRANSPDHAAAHLALS